MTFNKVILAGYLTRDPELRYTPKGTAVSTVGIALNRSWQDDTGAKREEVTFVECVAFAGTAEVLAKHMTKGRPLLIDGRLRMETWTDKQTDRQRSKLSVVIEHVQFLGDAKPAPRAERPQASAGTVAPDDDDLPF